VTAYDLTAPPRTTNLTAYDLTDSARERRLRRKAKAHDLYATKSRVDGRWYVCDLHTNIGLSHQGGMDLMWACRWLDDYLASR
jgi:hypothetical protein